MAHKIDTPREGRLEVSYKSVAASWFGDGCTKTEEEPRNESLKTPSQQFIHYGDVGSGNVNIKDCERSNENEFSRKEKTNEKITDFIGGKLQKKINKHKFKIEKAQKEIADSCKEDTRVCSSKDESRTTSTVGTPKKSFIQTPDMHGVESMKKCLEDSNLSNAAKRRLRGRLHKLQSPTSSITIETEGSPVNTLNESPLARISKYDSRTPVDLGAQKKNNLQTGNVDGKTLEFELDTSNGATPSKELGINLVDSSQQDSKEVKFEGGLQETNDSRQTRNLRSAITTKTKGSPMNTLNESPLAKISKYDSHMPVDTEGGIQKKNNLLTGTVDGKTLETQLDASNVETPSKELGINLVDSTQQDSKEGKFENLSNAARRRLRGRLYKLQSPSSITVGTEGSPMNTLSESPFARISKFDSRTPIDLEGVQKKNNLQTGDVDGKTLEFELDTSNGVTPSKELGINLVDSTQQDSKEVKFERGLQETNVSPQRRNLRRREEHDGFECSDCEKVFEFEEGKRRHVLEEHTGVIKCDRCNYVVSKSWAWMMKRHVERDTCKRTLERSGRSVSETERPSSSESTKVTGNIRRGKRGVFKCFDCGKVFQYKEGKRRHVLEEHTDVIKCDRCDYVVNKSRAWMMKRHKKLHPCKRTERSDRSVSVTERPPSRESTMDTRNIRQEFECFDCRNVNGNKEAKQVEKHADMVKCHKCHCDVNKSRAYRMKEPEKSTPDQKRLVENSKMLSVGTANSASPIIRQEFECFDCQNVNGNIEGKQVEKHADMVKCRKCHCDVNKSRAYKMKEHEKSMPDQKRLVEKSEMLSVETANSTSPIIRQQEFECFDCWNVFENKEKKQVVKCSKCQCVVSKSKAYKMKEHEKSTPDQNRSVEKSEMLSVETANSASPNIRCVSSGRTFKCFDCGEVFQSNLQRQTHLLEKHADVLRCGKCNYVVSKSMPYAMVDHEKNGCGNNRTVESSEVSVADLSPTTKSGMKTGKSASPSTSYFKTETVGSPLKSSNRKPRVKGSKNDSNTPEALDTATGKTTSKLERKKTGKRFGRREEPGVFKCFDCGKVFEYKEGKRRHVLEEHTDVIKCDRCHYVVSKSRAWMMEKHVKGHPCKRTLKRSDRSVSVTERQQSSESTMDTGNISCGKPKTVGSPLKSSNRKPCVKVSKNDSNTPETLDTATGKTKLKKKRKRTGHSFVKPKTVGSPLKSAKPCAKESKNDSNTPETLDTANGKTTSKKERKRTGKRRKRSELRPAIETLQTKKTKTDSDTPVKIDGGIPEGKKVKRTTFLKFSAVNGRTLPDEKPLKKWIRHS